MRIFVGIAFVVLGVVVLLLTRQPAELADGQAGLAYTETEDGTLELNTGERGAQRVRPPQRDNGADEEWLSKFVLTERSGEQVGSEDLKGEPYVAGFFFSTCPSICVQQNGKVQELQEKFKDRPIRFLSISCDPEVDSPEVLVEYAKRFDADADQWLFLTGKMDYIRRVGSEFFSLGVVRRGHPEKFALMDANGEPFGLYTWSEDAQWSALENDIERLIAAGGVLEDEASEAEADSQQEPQVEEGGQ